ncbi:MAG: hypothetical protein KDD65_01520 [Bacteroidetes bacterium]|nr:hypothetical protein [Bacteroidota bacterium]
MTQTLRLSLLVLLLVAGCRSSSERPSPAVAAPPAATSSTTDAPFEDEIRAFEAADAQKEQPKGAILFVGSSSIRLWTSLADDMAPIPIIRRGFGGAALSDCIRNVDRIVTPYDPRAIFVFCGTNDIVGDNPKSAEEVLALYKEFVDTVRESLPTTPIYFISISPTKSRWQHVAIVRKANELVKDYSDSSDLLHYIDAASALVSSSGEPRDELFREDQLHLSAEGYSVWTSIIRPIVEDAYRTNAGTE